MHGCMCVFLAHSCAWVLLVCLFPTQPPVGNSLTVALNGLQRTHWNAFVAFCLEMHSTEAISLFMRPIWFSFHVFVANCTIRSLPNCWRGTLLSNGVGVNPGGDLVCWDSRMSCNTGCTGRVSVQREVKALTVAVISLWKWDSESKRVRLT